MQFFSHDGFAVFGTVGMDVLKRFVKIVDRPNAHLVVEELGAEVFGCRLLQQLFRIGRAELFKAAFVGVDRDVFFREALDQCGKVGQS